MSETWRSAKAAEVKSGDVVRTERGEVVVVSHIESPFFGRSEMLAFIEDTPERWYKRPMPVDAAVEIRVSEG
jgi:hypothetical protein